ncbi:FAD-dependent oxidoreductase, partial [Guyparkeria sp. 1SP6A2]|nr:FAD-dependent oxidoreductase [Guyparkeria sp. 1SP6A2]
PLWQPCGVVQLALSEKEESRQQRFMAHHPLPKTLVSASEAPDALAGVPTAAAQGLFYPQAGWVQPKRLCEQLLQHPGITLRHGEATALHATPAGWQITLANGDTLAADQVVIAT